MSKFPANKPSRDPNVRTSYDQPTIMLVDDDERFRERLAKALRSRGYCTFEAPTGAEAETIARRELPELAVVDLRLVGEWGLNVVKTLKSLDPETQIVVLTAYGSIATAMEAVKLGATGFLQKPASVDEILHALPRPHRPWRRGRAPTRPQSKRPFCHRHRSGAGDPDGQPPAKVPSSRGQNGSTSTGC